MIKIAFFSALQGKGPFPSQAPLLFFQYFPESLSRDPKSGKVNLFIQQGELKKSLRKKLIFSAYSPTS